MKVYTCNLTHKFFNCLVAILAAIAMFGCAASAPTTPVQIPSSIEFSDSAIVLNMQESTTLSIQSETATGAVPAIDVKFTDLGTGEIDTTGKCGTSEVATDTVVLTGPNNWPNAQSRCTVCFEYDGACLPVNFEASPSITVPNGTEKMQPLMSSSTTEPVVIISLGTTMPFAVEENTGNLLNDGNDIHGIVDSFMMYEHGDKDSTSYSFAFHSCIRSLRDVSGNGELFELGPYVHMVSDGSSTASADVSIYDELTFINPNPDDGPSSVTYDDIAGSVTFDKCVVDSFDNSNDVQKTAIALSLRFNDDDNTAYIFLGEDSSALKLVYTVDNNLSLENLKLDSQGRSHIFYSYGVGSTKIEHQIVCSNGECPSEPEVIATQPTNNNGDPNVMRYNNVLYYPYVQATDEGAALYIVPITADTIDTEHKILVTTTDETRGDIRDNDMSVGLNSLTNKPMIAITYHYDNELAIFARYINVDTSFVSDEVQINNEPDVASVTGGITGVLADGKMLFVYAYDSDTEVNLIYARAEIGANNELVVANRTNVSLASMFVNYDNAAAVITDTGKVYGLVAKNDLERDVTEGMSLGMGTYTSTTQATTVTTNE